MSNDCMQVMVKEFVDKYGKKEFETGEHIKGEIGDCLFSLLALCNSLDINAQDSLCKSLRRYAERFESKGDIGSRILEV